MLKYIKSQKGKKNPTTIPLRTETQAEVALILVIADRYIKIPGITLFCVF